MWSGAWPSLELQQSRYRLVELRKTAAELPLGTDEALSSALARFLVIRSAGHIEFTVDECVHSFARAKSHPDIAGYVKATLFTGRNPSPGNLHRQVSRLSSVWSDALAQELSKDDESIKRSLSFLVDRRNLIAHGQNENIGMRKSLELCEMAVGLGDWLVATIDPRS